VADIPSHALPVREAIARHLAATRHATDHGWRGAAGDETAWEQRDQDVLGVWLSEADILLRYLTRPGVLAEVAAMAGGDVACWPTEYALNAVGREAAEDLDGSSWTVTVAWRGGDRWAVLRGPFSLTSQHGVREWGVEPHPSSRDDTYLARARYSLSEALQLAREEAPRVTINGYTVEDARRMAAHRKDRADA